MTSNITLTLLAKHHLLEILLNYSPDHQRHLSTLSLDSIAFEYLSLTPSVCFTHKNILLENIVI
jgi:hypothetical protein